MIERKNVTKAIRSRFPQLIGEGAWKPAC